MWGISVDSSRAFKKLDRAETSQVPFAAALALNAVAHQTVQDTKPELERVLDRPTRFTVNSFRFTRAYKRNLTATVRRKTAQSKRRYLEAQSDGGARRQTGMERKLRVGRGLKTITPAKGARRTAAGNWAPAQRKRALAARTGDGGKLFTVTSGRGLSPGIYERMSRRKVKKIANLTKATPRYDKRFDLVKVARDRVIRSFGSEFKKSMRRAMATAR